MSLLEILQKQKENLEKELSSLYEGLMNAGIGTVGDYKNKISLLESQLREVNAKIASNAKEETGMVESPAADVKIIKLFLASSAELKPERDQFEIFINRENNNLITEKKFLRLIVWEDFIDAMSKDGLQKEYNKAIRESDIFVSLFATKVGLYTEEEFDTAFGQFKESGKPKVYTYFKDQQANENPSGPDAQSLVAFKGKLAKSGHYITTFSDINDLKYQFKMQLQKLLPLLK